MVAITYIGDGTNLIIQCAPKAHVTCGGRIHPDSSRFDLIAGERCAWETGRADDLRGSLYSGLCAPTCRSQRLTTIA
jgi:hypothetical protein